MINLQNGSIPTPVDAIEIDKAILDLQTRLSASLSWLSHGYGKTYRNIDVSQSLTVYFPEVFLGNNAYMRVTPDNDKQGQSLILVGNEDVLDNDLGQNSHLQYDVSIIFTANLKLINSTLLETEYYQQNLIRDVRHVLQSATLGAFYQITMDSIDRDFTDVWREFNIEEKRGISHAPFTHFRVNCTVTLKEDCVTAPFDRCATILNMTTQAEQDCLGAALGGGPCDYNDCSTLLANLTAVTKNTCILPTYDFTDLDVQANVTTQQQTDLQAWLCTPACTGDFKVDDLAHAQQITYNVNDTVCISDTLYKAVNIGVFTNTGNASSSITEDSSGNKYFLSYDQDTYGSLLMLTSAGVLFRLVQFNNTDSLGYNPVGSLTLDNGVLYFESNFGSTNNLGGLLKYDISSGVCSLVLAYDATNTGFLQLSRANMQTPEKRVVGSNIYLLTMQGGANNKGCILKINTNTGAYTKIHDINTVFLGSQRGDDRSPAEIVNNKYYLFVYRDLHIIDLSNDNLTILDLSLQGLATTISGSRPIQTFVDGSYIYGVTAGQAQMFKFDTTTNTLTISVVNINVYRSSYVCFKDNNAFYALSFLNNNLYKWDEVNNTISISFDHNLSFTADGIFNINGSFDINTGILYYTSGQNSAAQKHLRKYNVFTKTLERVYDHANPPSSFTPDGVNYLEVNQAPIYLELC